MMNINRLRSTQSDMAMYHMEIMCRSIILFVAMTLCFYSYIPLWALIVVNILVYPGVYLRAHDIGHSMPIKRYGFVARFIPVSNPIWGGTRIFAKIHVEHHKYLGMAQDPWLPYYCGHPLKALLFSFIEPEYSCSIFIRRFGLDYELIQNIAFNICIFILGIIYFQYIYLINVLSIRIVHMIAIFFFNFYTHRESFSADAPIGAYERENDLKKISPLLRFLWGNNLVDGLIYHNRHHCVGQVYVPVEKYKNLQDTGIYTRFSQNIVN